MNNGTTNDNWTFALRWLFTSAVGLVMGGVLAFTLFWSVGGRLEQALGEAVAYGIGGGLLGALFALGVSLGPGLLLEGRGLRARRWVAASVLGGTLGMALTMPLVFALLDVDRMPEVMAALIMGLAMGLPIGIAQWWVLSQHGMQTIEWPLVSAVAFVTGLMIGMPLGGENREWLALGVTGLLVGAITALGIVWTLRRQTALPA